MLAPGNKREAGSLGIAKEDIMPSIPWTEWQRLMRAGTMWGGTLAASQTVVAHRRKSIEAAMSDPINADHAELGRMVTEKGTACAAAGASLSRDWAARRWRAAFGR